MPIGTYRQKGRDDGQSWLTTFGDMVTLLFTFFVLVYSFCSYTPGDWETAVGSIRGALAVIPGNQGNRVIPGGGSGTFPDHAGVVPLFAEVGAFDEVEPGTFDDEVEAIREQLEGIDGVDIQKTKSGVIFRVETPLLFGMGQATTKPSAESFLKAIGRATRRAPAIVIVTGHTCDLPISTAEYQSNWELSARRATNVLRMIESEAGADARFVALARGEFDPLVPNLDEGCRMVNRRVEIAIDLEGGLPFGQ
jgi:chemotaxis protein MotB